MNHSIWLICLLGAASCGTGGLEQVEVAGECAGKSACGGDLSDGPLAVGASYELRPRLDIPGTGTPRTTIRSADGAVIEVAGDRLIGVGPGMSAVLIFDDSGLVLDFFHVFVELPDHLQLLREVSGEIAGADLDGTVQLLQGDELSLATRPSKENQLLVGAAASEWSTSSPAVSILADGDPARRRLVAREVGIAEITIASMGLSRTLTIEVLP